MYAFGSGHCPATGVSGWIYALVGLALLVGIAIGACARWLIGLFRRS